MSDPTRIGLDEQIAAVKREIAYRNSVYPEIVAEGVMPAKKAAVEIALMRAVLATLRQLRVDSDA